MAPLPHFSIAFSPNGKLIAALSATVDGSRRKPILVPKLSLFQVPGLQPFLTMPSYRAKADYFAFTRSGTAFVNGTIEGNGLAQVWDTTSGVCLQTFSGAYIARLSDDCARLFLSSGYTHCAVEVVRLAPLDFLLLPLSGMPADVLIGVREIAATPAGGLERALFDLGVAIRPSIARDTLDGK